MNDQQELVFPMARDSDPQTSHDAAEEHAKRKLSVRRAQVLELVRKYPGSTQGELSRRMYSEYDFLPIATCVASPHKRLPELERLGQVTRGPERPCTDSGYNNITWFPVNSES